MAIPRSPVLSEELESLDNEQCLWIAEHPCFWMPRTPFCEDLDDDFRDPLESPAGGSNATNLTDDGDTTMTHDDRTVKGKARATDNGLGLSNIAGLSVNGSGPLPSSVPPLTLPAPRMTDDHNSAALTRLHEETVRRAALAGATSKGQYETNAGRVFKDWSFMNCPQYNGLVKHKAFLDYEDAINSGGRPGNWAAFCRWLLKLNPLCVSKDLILNDYDRLYQQPNEMAQSFFQRFRQWQHKVKNYGFHYEASSGFVTHLNRGLKEKVKGIVAMERRRGTPLSFDQIVVTALEEDQTY
ncbi:hypothetical protein PTTG_27133 [Puccinia triticina 1-1 BBBD Race 1]|uniref:Uncharacterized protein n=1 Tax=Puccinia triticina (isolate 1-1 / race 1 (BBBD)) TaxID=630390 RepID=A0A180GN40_PUCT1|nr:hypothetical protein PTTG_27133 [Puccinia triticina 1-1 BBBD Race 1]